MNVQLYNDDCLNALKKMEDNSIDSCVTDPPYGLSFMGKSWDYDVPKAEIWKEVLRVLKPGGHLLAFFGSRTYHRGVVQIEDAGFEVRDQIMWLYGSGFPKSHNIGNGWGTALKPAHEPIVVARKPITQTVAKNVLEYGTGALNINGCRVEINPEVDDPRLGGKGTWKTEKMAQNVYEGGYAGKEVGSSALGRWPANVIHDGSDEVISQFPESKSGKDKGLRGTGGIWSKSSGIPCGPQYGDSGSAARFFYCAKASKADRDEGLNNMSAKKVVTFATENGTSGKPSSLSAGRDTEYKNNHPTVKPTELMRYLCRLVTPKGGIVLDPFMGSGSTGKAALLEGFRFIGIEMSEEYFEIAKARVEAADNNKVSSLENFFTE